MPDPERGGVVERDASFVLQLLGERRAEEIRAPDDDGVRFGGRDFTSHAADVVFWKARISQIVGESGVPLGRAAIALACESLDDLLLIRLRIGRKEADGLGPYDFQLLFQRYRRGCGAVSGFACSTLLPAPTHLKG